jgi:hypothetical protein
LVERTGRIGAAARGLEMAGHDHTQAVQEHSDEWHHHSAAEGRPQHEHAAIANPGALLKWFMLIVIALVVTLVALIMYFQNYYSTVMRPAVIETTNLSTGANTARASAESRLGTNEPISKYQYKPADPKARTVQIHIEQAMQKTIEKYSRK